MAEIGAAEGRLADAQNVNSFLWLSWSGFLRLRVPSSPPLPARRVGAACDITSMVCCLLCFDDSPVDDDPRAGFQREWEAGLQDAACASPTFCCCGLLCPGPTAYYLRQQVC